MLFSSFTKLQIYSIKTGSVTEGEVLLKCILKHIYSYVLINISHKYKCRVLSSNMYNNCVFKSNKEGILKLPRLSVPPCFHPEYGIQTATLPLLLGAKNTFVL